MQACVRLCPLYPEIFIWYIVIAQFGGAEDGRPENGRPSQFLSLSFSGLLFSSVYFFGLPISGRRHRFTALYCHYPVPCTYDTHSHSIVKDSFKVYVGQPVALLISTSVVQHSVWLLIVHLPSLSVVLNCLVLPFSWICRGSDNLT